ncbi:PTS sugar transporter subunit IIA [Alphaproteobacteria bacterium]|nr:PTS sugar transporter subunit IIA [Alphaproteobacteria bacterium]
MNDGSFIEKKQILVGLKVNSKKHLIETLCVHVAKTHNIESRDLCAAVMKRERLGSTGVGNGVAIPHAAISSVDEPIAVMAILDTPIAFDAADGRDVDIACLVIGPEASDQAQLKMLSSVSKVLRKATSCSKLREAQTSDDALIAIQNIAQPKAA